MSVNDAGEVTTEGAAVELANTGLAQTYAEAGTPTPDEGDPNAEQNMDDQEMDGGDADMHPGAQETAASGRGSGGGGQGKGGGTANAAKKICKKGPAPNIFRRRRRRGYPPAMNDTRCSPRSTRREPRRLCEHEEAAGGSCPSAVGTRTARCGPKRRQHSRNSSNASTPTPWISRDGAGMGGHR